MAEDPFEVLGIAPGSTAEQVKGAYRRAILQCHPDRCRSNPVGALRRFLQVNKAYRTIMRRYRPAAQPEEFARADLGWLFQPHAGRGPGGNWPPPGSPSAVKLSRPTRNENRTFACFWALALAMAVAAGLLWIKFHMGRRFADELGASDFLVLYGLSVGVYLAVIAVALLLVLLSRQIIFLTLRLALGASRLLPAPQETDPAPKG